MKIHQTLLATAVSMAATFTSPGASAAPGSAELEKLVADPAMTHLIDLANKRELNKVSGKKAARLESPGKRVGNNRGGKNGCKGRKGCFPLKLTLGVRVTF